MKKVTIRHTKQYEVVVDDGKKISVRNFKTNAKLEQFRTWDELLNGLSNGSVIHVEKAFQSFDIALKMFIISACKQLGIKLLTYPNQAVMNAARDAGVPFKAENKEQHYKAASLLRDAILSGSATPMEARINPPGKFDRINAVRAEGQKIYQLLRMSDNATREFPAISGVEITPELQAILELEKQTVKRLLSYVTVPTKIEGNSVLEDLLHDTGRLLKFTALIEAVKNSGGGFNMVQDVGGFFAHSYGSSWSAYVDHDWLPVWVREHHAESITHPKATAYQRPLEAYKEFKKEYRQEFYDKFTLALKWLFEEVSTHMDKELAAHHCS